MRQLWAGLVSVALLAAGGALAAEAGVAVAEAGVAVADGQLVFRAADGTLLLRGLTYEARDAAGLALQTSRVVADGPAAARCELTGPAAADASLTVSWTPRSQGVALDWVLRTNGTPREWKRWGSAFRFAFARPVTGAAAEALVKWVKPTGAEPYEVPGDTPYPATEGQMRVVNLGDRALTMVSERYDPDWIYGGNLDRAASWALCPAKESPGEVKVRMVLLDTGAAAPTPAAVAARAGGRPLALSLSTGRFANLFTPGETVPLTATVENVTTAPVTGQLAIAAHDYASRVLVSETTPVTLQPGQRRPETRVLRPTGRGIVFITATLTWPGGETVVRTNVGLLPERRAAGVAPESPFGLAAITTNPAAYPDQFPLAQVLPLAERIGARWVRGGFFPLKADPTAAEAQTVRERAALLRRHGLLPHVQLGATVPEPGQEAAFRDQFAAALERFRDVSPFVEVGNELNFGAKAPDYVTRLLDPVSQAMRRVHPDGQTMTMGLGGVTQDWLKAFVAAGGLDRAQVLSIHPGCQPRAPEFWEGWRGWVFRSQVQDALAAAAAHGNRDVWITEAYAPTAPDRAQTDVRTAADYLVRTYVCALALGVKVVEWYQFQDGVWFARRPEPADAEYNFGLVYSDLTPKPGYVAYGAMTEQLAGARYVGRLDLGAEDLYGVRFTRAGQTVDVLWSYREKHETDLAWWPPEKFAGKSRSPGEPWVERWRQPVNISLPVAGPVQVTDLMGNSRAMAAPEGKVALALTGSPVYVTGLGQIPLRARFWEALP